MDRHLLPDEIDQLLDGEVGFGIAPLRAHVRQCARCRTEVEEAQALVSALEHLPHLAPSPAFQARVMANVRVFVPWHVALRDTVQRWRPQSRSGRAAASVAVGVGTLVMASLAVFVLTHFDVVVFAAGLGLQRVRELAITGGGHLLGALVGEPAAAAVRGWGIAGLLLTFTVLLLVTAAAARVLRAVATAPRRS
ncbi:MAG TPA: hypothetical protein VFK13_01915 [Gemmatimonadaceae bacterium]|nr:hypothetical protein [Gemmatimonadaceae bacterium]